MCDITTKADVSAWNAAILVRGLLAPRKARQAVRSWLGAEHPLRADVEQVVAELVNNSVVHVPVTREGDWVRVRLGFGDRFVRVDVVDPGMETADENFIPRRPETAEENGRGLYIAAAVSERLGSFVDERGYRHVWCDFALPEPS
ncbi:ATP-binding protein [Nonomuraea sp. MG754425]|uniref:ATP-binding protein n=1 Tax=Nonomuraea sp. MG754425 TaxID=2570319 RepID=UPI001F246FBA|nr:ATP-binding protein [Nonomuraea sp. MG754425]MCF6472110.1 ATP-binding protein [Nonomuraea sp. MG754425]